MNRSVSEITVAVQDRPRNQYAIEEARAAGARVRIFSDGDVAMALMAMMDEHSRIDMLAGIGGAPEGVIAACAARALGAAMECRLWGAQTGRILALDDLCGAEETFFAASGVTDGELLEGVSYSHGFARTQSILVSSYTGAVRRISSQHVLSPALAAV
jgi:fructose-1,6-bisphosphatase II